MSEKFVSNKRFVIKLKFVFIIRILILIEEVEIDPKNPN